MGAPKKADWREERRKRAWKLKEEGWPQKDIAAALGVSEGAVSHWVKRGREGGEEALKQWSDERWPQIKKSQGGQSHHRLGRRSGLLSVTDGSAHLGAPWADASLAGETHA